MFDAKLLSSLIGDATILALGIGAWAIDGESALSGLARAGVLGLLCAIFIGQAWLRELRLAKEYAERELLLREDIKATRDELREVRESAIIVVAKHAEQAEKVAAVMAQTVSVLKAFARSHPCAVSTMAPEVYARFVSEAAQREDTENH